MPSVHISAFIRAQQAIKRAFTRREMRLRRLLCDLNLERSLLKFPKLNELDYRAAFLMSAMLKGKTSGSCEKPSGEKNKQGKRRTCPKSSSDLLKLLVKDLVVLFNEREFLAVHKTASMNEAKADQMFQAWFNSGTKKLLDLLAEFKGGLDAIVTKHADLLKERNAIQAKGRDIERALKDVENQAQLFGIRL